MKNKWKSLLAGILCFSCLPVMPLCASAELIINEYDHTFESFDGLNTNHIVELESDLFRYTSIGHYSDPHDASTPLYYDGGGVLETDVVDVNYIVTDVYYREGESEPFLYTLNGLKKFTSSNVRCYASDISPLLSGDILEAGDLLCIENYICQETYPPVMVMLDDSIVKNLGSGIDIFGEDFKKVLYYEMFSEPEITTVSGVRSASQSGYRYELYDKGNLNNDNSINLIDVVTLNKHLMVGKPLGYYAKGCADVDSNGEVNAVDSLNILKYCIGLIDSFEAL